MITALVRKKNVDSTWGNKKKGREKPNITLLEVVKNDMSIKWVTESIILDKIEWWKTIHVTNPNWSVRSQHVGIMWKSWCGSY